MSIVAKTPDLKTLDESRGLWRPLLLGFFKKGVITELLVGKTQTLVGKHSSRD